ncbi:MAG: serine protease [Geminicoccaceae bacterium]|nr:serine protease [Geminicoccaceae bacterium]
MTDNAARKPGGRRPETWCQRLAWVAVLLISLANPALVLAQSARPDPLEAVVQVSAVIPGDARTADTLGTEREGTGVVIDDSGLILTIGYLILEASEVSVTGSGNPVAADIVAYDHESGFGLVRAQRPLDSGPLALGDSAALRPRQPLLVVSRVGGFDAGGVYVVDRRVFAGYWEYLLEDAIFTAPPRADFGGAALIDEDGRLVGIGSLIVNDAAQDGRPVPGNMFVPINHLKPIMGDLLANGRRSDPPRPWLGVSLEEHRGRVFVTRVTPEGPAASAGIVENDLILGVGGAPVVGLTDFYRKIWSLGEAGVTVPLDLLQGTETRAMAVRSGNRYRYLKLNPTY